MTVEALAAGDQVLIVRKGGIGEKRFELPHPRFYLFPTYAHQRPELVKPAGRRASATPVAARGAERLPLPAYAELHSAHPIADPEALAAIDGLHILAPPTPRSGCAGGALRSGRPSCASGRCRPRRSSRTRPPTAAA